MENTIYKETQYFKLLIVTFSASMVFTFLVYYFKWGNPEKLLVIKPLIFLEFLFIVIMAIFYKLVVEIRGRFLQVTFGIGLIKKKIALDDIQKESIVVRKIPLIYGIGIRITPFGTLYNTVPGEAIAFKYNNKKIAIGTKNSTEMVRLLKH